jgi:hypothetical protein
MDRNSLAGTKRPPKDNSELQAYVRKVFEARNGLYGARSGATGRYSKVPSRITPTDLTALFDVGKDNVPRSFSLRTFNKESSDWIKDSSNSNL